MTYFSLYGFHSEREERAGRALSVVEDVKCVVVVFELCKWILESRRRALNLLVAGFALRLALLKSGLVLFERRMFITD